MFARLSLSSSALFNLRKQPCASKQKFPWKSEGSDSVCKQRKTRGNTHFVVQNVKKKKSSLPCDPISQMQKIIPASILNKLLHRHIYHWRRCAQKVAFVTKGILGCLQQVSSDQSHCIHAVKSKAFKIQYLLKKETWEK